MPQNFVFQVVDGPVTEVPVGVDGVLFKDGEDEVILVANERWNDLGLLIERRISRKVQSWEKIPAQRKFIFHSQGHKRATMEGEWREDDHVES